MKIAPLLYALLCSTLLVLPAHAAEEAAAPKVNGVTIPQSRIDAFAKMQTAQGQPDTPELRTRIRDYLVRQEVLAQEAAKRGLDKSPETASQLDLARQEVLANAFVQDYVKKNPVSDEALRKEYDRVKADVG